MNDDLWMCCVAWCGNRGCWEECADDPVHPAPVRGRVRPHDRGQLPEAGRDRRGDVCARHPRHRRPGGVLRHARPGQVESGQVTSFIHFLHHTSLHVLTSRLNYFNLTLN